MTVPATTGLRQLVLAREFFDRGCADLRAPGPMSIGFAVSAFQDAVELALVAVAHRMSAGLEQGFESLWRSIDQRCGPSGQLPRKPSMQALNKARVGFKHYGTLPNTEEAAEFRADAHLFLREISTQYFSQDFDSISEIELLNEGDLKACLRRCAKVLADGSIREALEACADVRELIRKSEEPLYQTSLLVQFNNVPTEIRREISLQATNLREQLWRVRELLLASCFGINLVELRLLQGIVPIRIGATYEWPTGSPDNVTPESTRRAIALLTRYAINVSRMWSAMSHPSWDRA